MMQFHVCFALTSLNFKALFPCIYQLIYSFYLITNKYFCRWWICFWVSLNTRHGIVFLESPMKACLGSDVYISYILVPIRRVPPSNFSLEGLTVTVTESAAVMQPLVSCTSCSLPKSLIDTFYSLIESSLQNLWSEFDQLSLHRIKPNRKELIQRRPRIKPVKDTLSA
jgi:glucose-6-phosphate-specific signal transduction histidine kinase